MAIRDASELQARKIQLDLTGPDGNAFVLLGHARTLSKHLHLDFKPIQEEMTAGDYDNLVNVFDEYFGEYVDLYR